MLTLVSAPAGYGKTTAIRMWVKQAGCPVAWVTLDKSDNKIIQFLAYVLTALGEAVEQLGQSALEMVENAPEANCQAVLDLLINDLCGLDQPVILVLEEYHLIENETIDQAVEFLLNQSVANLHLVIATREDPNLPLTRLRARNQLTEVRAADLSFSFEEAREFFASAMGVSLSESEIEILKNRTEGWVAGLQLAALSLKKGRDAAKFVETFRGTHRHVLDYLIEEVLNNQPEAIRVFLRRTSILDQLSPALCEAVTGQKESGEYLKYLENNNLFVVSLDEERRWYRYHALFAELLKNQLVQNEADLIDVLNERAAEWYEKNGLIQRAVEHAFQVTGGNTASRLIERHAIPLLYQGEVATVLKWFERLSEPLIKSSPMMCISRAWSLALMQRQARVEEVQQILRAVDGALDRTNADETQRNLIAGHAASIRAFLMQTSALSSGEPEKLIEASQEALRLLPQDEKGIRSVNALNIGYGYVALADVLAAEKAFKQALEDGLAGGNLYAAVYSPINLIIIAIFQGRLDDALRLCETNIELFNRLLAGQNFPLMGGLYILKGDILLEENRLEEAEAALTQGLSLIRWTGEYETHTRGYSALARYHSARGDWASVRENMRILEETWPEGSLYTQSLKHRFTLRHPGVNQTTFENARFWAAQNANQLSALPDVTGVDPMSEKVFQTRLCMAHVLVRLAVQQPQAHSLTDTMDYFARQERFAEANRLTGWLIEIRILRALIYQAEGKLEEARGAIGSALEAAAPRGYFRVFLDEGRLLQPLLESLLRHSTAHNLTAYIKRLLEAMPGAPAKTKTDAADTARLSEREIEVLRLLAGGLSYKEIGERLFLSLNTVQFHAKSIYRKLSVNKRMQAVEKARQMQLI